MTPLVDVMLVLLIIMMLIAPHAPAGRGRHAAGGGEHRRQARHPGPDGRRDRLARQVLRQRAAGRTPTISIPQVQRVLEDKKEKIVYLKGDKDAQYAAIMDAMDAFRKAQIENIALITETQEPAGRGAGGGQ